LCRSVQRVRQSDDGPYSAAFRCASSRTSFQAALSIKSEDVVAAARGHARTRARTRAAREVLQPTNLFGVAAAGPAAGGIQRIRPAASTMAAMPGLDQLNADYAQFMAIHTNEQTEFLKERRAWKPMLGISPLPHSGPG